MKENKERKHPQCSGSTLLNQKQKTAAQAGPLPDFHRQADGWRLEDISRVVVAARSHRVFQG